MILFDDFVGEEASYVCIKARTLSFVVDFRGETNGRNDLDGLWWGRWWRREVVICVVDEDHKRRCPH